ncbi:hypothetical protein LV779_26510 [Streptomyces thinghirensis]|nr:hypothetical protein [Streptomyces thinghirensis]
MHQYRLGTHSHPRTRTGGPRPGPGRAGPDYLMRWCRELAADLGETVTIDAASSGTGSALRRGGATPSGRPGRHPRLQAGVNPLVAGMVEVDPVYTPATSPGRRLRGRRDGRGRPSRAHLGRHGGRLYTRRDQPHQQRPLPAPRVPPRSPTGRRATSRTPNRGLVNARNAEGPLGPPRRRGRR